MKNISIITFHNAHNYGAMLQAYALCSFLTKCGYNVQILDYRNKNIEKQYKVIKFYGKNPIKLGKQFICIVKNYSKNKKRYKAFEDFFKNKLICSKNTYYDTKNIKEDYQIYITGSDQVWNINIVGELSDAYTLNFGNPEAIRISYAASIGNSEIEEKYKEQYKNKLKIIDHISVREEEAKITLQPLVNKPIDVVLDPTLLITKQEWENDIKDLKNENEKYILAYVVSEDKEYRDIVNYMSKETNLKIIHFENKDNYDNVLRSAYTEGPLEFINLIKNSEYVICTSFHATVFSIIFHKNFYVIPNKKTGSRVTNLLKKLGLEDRAYNTYDEFKGIDYKSKIDWNEVEKKLEAEREKSITWLKDAIEGTETNIG